MNDTRDPRRRLPPEVLDRLARALAALLDEQRETRRRLQRMREGQR